MRACARSSGRSLSDLVADALISFLGNGHRSGNKRNDFEVVMHHEFDRLGMEKVSQVYEVLVPASEWLAKRKQMTIEREEINEQGGSNLRASIIGSPT